MYTYAQAHRECVVVVLEKSGPLTLILRRLRGEKERKHIHNPATHTGQYWFSVSPKSDKKGEGSGEEVANIKEPNTFQLPLQRILPNTLTSLWGKHCGILAHQQQGSYGLARYVHVSSILPRIV